MSKTRDEMIYRALMKLGVNNSGQTVSEEDHTRVDDNLEPIFAELSALRIYYVSDYESYDESEFEPLAEYLAAGMCEDFAQDRNAWEARKNAAIDRLERIAAPGSTNEPLRADDVLRQGARQPGRATYLNG